MMADAERVSVHWEPIDDNYACELVRARVPGGWLVRAVSHVETWNPARNIAVDSYVSSIAFVPDPEKLWK